MSAEADARRVILDAAAARVFPAAVAEVGDSGGPIWTEAFGRLTFDAGAPPATNAVVFDLASLTKPMVTTTAVMELVRSGRLALDERLADVFPEWRGADREAANVRDLLEHSSGLPSRFVDTPPDGAREFEHEICTIRLEYAPRTASVYSDLGFVLLGLLVARRGEAPLDVQFDRICRRIAVEGLWFPAGRTHRFAAAPVDEDPGGRPGSARGPIFAPTMPLPEDRRKRRLAGEVHDNYADALGGVAGHAGLFGAGEAVGAFARIVLRAARGDAAAPAPLTADAVALVTRRTTVPGSSRALGWDTMLPTSSCGIHMSREAFGHVGFTGTSLWIDPPRDRYFVLLTNRACGGGSVAAMRDVRRAFHDAFA